MLNGKVRFGAVGFCLLVFGWVVQGKDLFWGKGEVLVTRCVAVWGCVGWVTVRSGQDRYD